MKDKSNDTINNDTTLDGGEVKVSVEPRYTCPKTGAHFNF